MENEPALGQKLGAEVLGTFVLVLLGCGTAVVSGDYVATALAFGLAVLVMAFAVGHVSGGHFNPAVSVGFGISGRMPWNQVAMYAAAQLGGALLAGAVLFAVLHGYDGFDSEGNMGQNFFGEEAPDDFAVWAAFLVELLTTALFLLVILGVTDKRNPSSPAAPVAIGLALTAIHLTTIGMTGTSVNPARSIGVGVFAGTDAILQLWLFIVAPLLGAAAAGLVYPLLFGRDALPVPGSGLGSGRPHPRAAAAGGWQGEPYQQPGWDPNAPFQQQPAAPQWGEPDPGPQQWGQPDPSQQQWGQQPPPGGWGQPDPAPQQWGQQPPPGGWGQPDPGQQYPGQQYPGQQYPGQQYPPPGPAYGQPDSSQPYPPPPGEGQGWEQQPGQEQWPPPDEGDDQSRTQIRRPDQP